ncbi:MAG: hypothetical protein JO232_09465 [Verrucomicrobia bacterium]|nr:hypothetical protein [Verrucomicrobiota bacterium]
MKLNLHTRAVIAPTSNQSILTDQCSGSYLENIGRCAALAVALGFTAMLATGCSSTGQGFQARLMGPAPTTRHVPDSADKGGYQPTLCPAFDPDLFG